MSAEHHPHCKSPDIVFSCPSRPSRGRGKEVRVRAGAGEGGVQLVSGRGAGFDGVFVGVGDGRVRE